MVNTHGSNGHRDIDPVIVPYIFKKAKGVIIHLHGIGRHVSMEFPSVRMLDVLTH